MYKSQNKSTKSPFKHSHKNLAIFFLLFPVLQRKLKDVSLSMLNADHSKYVRLENHYVIV